MSGFLQVNYATSRRVFVNGIAVGMTNEVLEVGAGPFRVDMGKPLTYKPSFRRVNSAGPFDDPTVVDFEERGADA